MIFQSIYTTPAWGNLYIPEYVAVYIFVKIALGFDKKYMLQACLF